jgi:hypothetical protein
MFLKLPKKESGWIYPFIFLALFLTSCGIGSNKGPDSQVEVDSSELEAAFLENITNAKQVFYSLPSPLETAMLIKSAGARYNEELLNDLGNTSKYTTNKSMALNLGIYTTDLSYASLFDQTQTTINYMNAAKKMADGLGILDAIDKQTIERLEENVNNREVIMDIISETFMSSSSFLKENDRPAQAVIVLVGGWVEGLYIATQLVGDKPIKGNPLVDRIADQKLTLEIMLKLMDDNKTNPDIISLMPEINELVKLYDKVILTSGVTKTSQDQVANVTTLHSETTITITQEVFNELKDKAKSIRSNFIQ